MRRALSRSAAAALAVAAVAVLTALSVPAARGITAAPPESTNGTAAAPGGAAGTDREITITVDGLARSYRLFVPTQRPKQGYPLVVALHPLEGSGSSFEFTSKLDAGAARVGALVAYPQGYGGSWNAGTCCEPAHGDGVDDVAFLDAVIKDVESNYQVVADRTAMVGFSNGALMTYRYLCAGSSRVKVAFVASGAFVGPRCTFSRPMQIVAVHGLQDPLVPWAGTDSSTYTTDHVLPSVRQTTKVMAAADGCAADTRSTRSVSDLVEEYDAVDCPKGASVLLYRSRTLAHEWATGPSATDDYGLDETSMAWSFMLGAWRRTT